MKQSTLTILALLSFSVSKEQFQFQYHEIGEFGNRMGQTSLIDIDNDEDLDWVFGRFGEMYWYEYVSADEWVFHEMGKGAKTDVGGCPIDINNDGWIDYVVGDSWYENTGNPKSEQFILHKKNMIPCHDNIATDIDNDGITDIVSCSNHHDNPVLAWYKMPEDHTQNWDYHKIGKGIHGGISPHGFGDLDNDGDMDIVRGNAWFENEDGSGIKWEMHNNLIPEGGSRSDKFGLALKTWCLDLDNDNDLDIIEAEADTKSGRVYWFKNKENATKFEFHLISEEQTGQDMHSLAIADFDGDGDMDILSGGGPLSQETHKLFIWENVNSDGSRWKEHIILENKRVHETVAADVDMDGDIDICSKPWHGSLHFYLENKQID